MVRYWLSLCVSVPLPLVTVSDTSYTPGVAYVTVGETALLVAGVPPGKVHA